MKVKITHSINLEDVPEKASELLIPAEERLSNSLRWLGDLSRDLSRDNISAEMAVLSLDRIRRAMGECDHTLAEVEGILGGVAEYEKEQVLPPSPPMTQPSEGFHQMMEDIAKEKEKHDEPDLPF